MKAHICILILSSSFLLAKTENVQIQERISEYRGGIPAKAGQFPWQVLITLDNAWYLCGGALIGHKWVLAKSDCLVEATNVTVQLGGITVDSPQKAVRIKSYIQHPKYNSTSTVTDVALLRLKCPIKYTSMIQPIALPSANERVGVNVSLTVSGYVSTKDNTAGNKVLYYANVSTIENTECAKIYGETQVISTSLCARGRPHYSTCYGEMGGPLVQYDNKGVATLVGVVGFWSGSGCESSGNPTGFIRTASIRDWIYEHTGI